MNEKHSIHQAGLDDVRLLLDWSAAEGWNPGLHDAECFFNTDPQGFFIAKNPGGELIGGISAVAYDDEFGFVGFFIVIPSRRGHRVGLSLGYHALNYLDDRVVGLDGVPEKVRNYETHGFKMAYNNIRYQGVSGGGRVVDGLVAAESLPFDLLNAYDRRHFPADRRRFLALWLAGADRSALASLDEKGGIEGYGVIRRCRVGHKIGPLFANNKASAEKVLDGLLSTIPVGEMFFIDIPAVNEAAMAMARHRRLEPVFRTSRMYDRPVDLPVDGIFGVTSFELG